MNLHNMFQVLHDAFPSIPLTLCGNEWRSGEKGERGIKLLRNLLCHGVNSCSSGFIFLNRGIQDFKLRNLRESWPTNHLINLPWRAPVHALNSVYEPPYYISILFLKTCFIRFFFDLSLPLSSFYLF